MRYIGIACDHAGYDLKRAIIDFLSVNGLSVRDFGAHSRRSCHYPVYAKKVAEFVNDDPNNIGILVCGTGIGMSIVANRYPNVRAAICHSDYDARMSRKHIDANIICIGARTTTPELAREFVDVFLDTAFENGRHKKRVDQINPQLS